MSRFPSDYLERVYAGVLGKLIGVYLGRPFEGWGYRQILERLGPIRYYVHERLEKPLVVTDDDISGTFTFVRALEDFGCRADLSAAEIGRTWLNYIVEDRAILWWGGMGASTEHTAFARLKKGIAAPRSGSMELNGQVVAEQIGAQIFIDGWALVCPGDPERAAALAERAARVSHDGEAVHGAVALAAMEAQAFVEPDMDKLFDLARRFVPADCVIRRLTDEIRDWARADRDWEKTFARIEAAYGYDKFGGGCHMVPNHAVIVLALAYAPDDFQQALLIANTAGWDTDCNSGNVGCLLGIKLGLKGLDAGPDWRQPVADRLFLPTADGGRCVTDAARETCELAKTAHALYGEPFAAPKGGARFHFELPGSVQGFAFEESPECRCIGAVWNAAGHGAAGRRRLALGYNGLAPGRAARAATPTFIAPDAAKMPGYGLLASPTLYPGQTLRAAVEADAHNAQPVNAGLYVRYYGEQDRPAYARGEPRALAPGARAELEWLVPDLGGRPIFDVGLELASTERAGGVVYLDRLDWSGPPRVVFGHSGEKETFWQRAWVNAAERAGFGGPARPYRILQAEGTGLLIQGTREWAGYRVEALTVPHLAADAGLAACVQGQERYYALVLSHPNRIRLVKRFYGARVLAEAAFPWRFDQQVELALETRGGRLRAFAGGKLVLEARDEKDPLASGAVALLCAEGRTDWGPVKVTPLD
ncbi:MAG: ADP-ribosylglycohydrolase family protein [Planctomycetota bacterium]|nr:ADP-ribosylglycohydrolase family protein [Planctomycetota bacterium]